ncbi:Ig-like domain-containing protein [Daejeonella sp.]|uniref:Ig-like domain-containing protein n=1 Tax=Daejeonella sp. TaxID=2805397 RepID=UPI003983B3CE
MFFFCFFCCLSAYANLFNFKFNLKSASVAPEAVDVRNFSVQNVSGRIQILPLIGKDSDGTIVSFKILSLPAIAAGKLYLNNVLVFVNQSLTLAEAKNLQFDVMGSFDQPTAIFTYTVTDNESLTDATAATFTIPVVPNGTLLVCSGGTLGNNILGTQGTFSSPYITPKATISCINDNSSVAAPLQNLGNAPVPPITNYNYASTSGSLGPEGTYSFLKTLGTMASRNCIKSDWVASDHTGDGGYAMIVNGSPNLAAFGKTFYQATSMAVCPNTLYAFSAYVINVLPGNHSAAVAGTEPNISFYINSQLVSTSGSIAYSTASTGFVPQWVKVGGLWYSGPNTLVDFRIDNATFVAEGNDLGIDDISLAICGPSITYPDVSLTPKFCSYGVLPLKADVKASVNTYSSYIFQNSKDGGTTWTDMGTPKTGSPVYNSARQAYEYLAEYGDLPIAPSMNGYRYRLKVATEPLNLSGTTCNISADKIISVSAFEKPVAGADITGCNTSPTAKLVAAVIGETWSTVVGNPAVASIDQSGNISGMVANGIYKFQLTNKGGCSDTVNVTREQVKVAGADVHICSPQDTYKLAEAGTGYKWEKVTGNPADATIHVTTGLITGMNADGIYKFVLRSDLGCTDEILVTKSSISLSYIKTNVRCFGTSTGAINLSITGGTAPYTYAWTGGVTTEDLTGLAAGTYNVNVTDANNCTATASIVITSPASALVLTSAKTDVLCFGATTGSVNLSVTGGTAPYTYTWTGGVTTEDLTGLAAGTYSVTVTDANNCTATASITVAQPATAFALNSTKTNVLCFGTLTGAINLSVAGGTAPYTYAWTGGIATEDLTGLVAGTYNVTVTDANSCTATASVNISSPASALALTSAKTDVLCFGTTSGLVNLSVTGGTAPYSYAWTGGITTEDLTGLAAGTYNVTVTDANNCSATTSVIISAPAATLALTSVKTDVICFGTSTGAINLSVRGGTSPYTYAWTGGITTEDLTGLAAGNYNATVTDANNCSATTSVIISAPATALALTSAKTDVLCFGATTGSVNLSVTGGTAPYIYAWTGGGTTEDLTGLSAGTFNVTVTDANGCIKTETVTINHPKSLKISLTARNATCASAKDGSILALLTGGTAPYKITWNGNISLTSTELKNVAAGVYEILVTDASGCNVSAKAEVFQGTCSPIAKDDNFIVDQGLMLSADVAPNDWDPQTGKLTFTKLTDPKNGTLTFDQDGKISFMPDSGFAGRVDFSYQICNPLGACHSAVVTINVIEYTIVHLTPELSSVREGKTVSVTARLVRPFKEDVTITIEYSGKALKERDYLVLDNYQSLTIPKGQISTTQKMTFAAVHDAFQEVDEDIILAINTVSHIDVRIGNGAVVIINDFYPPPTPTEKPQDEPNNAAILPDPLMSPNGDGNGNEFFAIQNIEAFQDNEVLIFNRWGNELFTIKNYNNGDKAFRGYANKGLLVNSELPLTDGVYFFIINTYSLAVGKRVKQVNKGYLILKR